MPLNYSRWKHRITYSLSPVTTVNDRWVTLTLPWRPGINSDYSDIRITDTAGHSLSYNIASKTDRETATVKIEIPIAGTRLIHCYFGNSQAVSESAAAGTEDANPVLTAVSGTTNPEYSGVWTLSQGGRLNQQGYVSSKQSGPYPQWRYKALIKITNSVPTTNYQHKLTLTWRPGMRADFRDIRFAQTNGKKCDYWIESYTPRSSAVVWIEVPTAGQRWLNLYYGNSRAASESNGNNTFDFFDDFTTNTVGTKWTLSGSNHQITGGVLQSKYYDTSAIPKYLKSTTAYNPNTHALRIRHKSTTTSDEVEIIGLYYSDTRWGAVAINPYNGAGDRAWDWAVYSDGAPWGTTGGDGTLSVNTYYIIDLYKPSATTYGIKINNAALNTVSCSNQDSDHNVGFCAWGSTSNYNFITDWVIVRKYTATEPTLSIISHQPNSPRLTPYEMLGEQPTGGNTYIMDPIESSLTLSGSIGATVLSPLVSAELTIAPSAPITTLAPLVEAGLTLSGSVIGKLYIPLDELDITQFSVSRGVSDDIWAMSATIDGLNEINTDVLRHATFFTTDHLGVSQSIFAGILPKGAYTIREAANKTVITGYDYAWYLSRQQVQTAYQHNTAGTNPADVITGLLGGDDWEETTGIMPYKINSVTAWGDTLNSRVFDFTIGTTKKQAIDKICNYCRFVFMVKWIVVDGIATPAAYFVSEDDIDDDLDLPDPVTFAYPDPYLVGEIKPVAKGDERYNRVTVIGRNNAGGVFSATVESASVTNGDELAVEKIENSGSWTTQDQVNARAAELYAYYSATAYTFTAKLLDRMDLELLQKIRITGYTGVSENWMRITRIKKTVRATKDGVEKLIEIEFTENVKWSALRRMYRYSSDDITNEIETIVDNKISLVPGLQVGVCTAIDGQAATVTLESGETITTRCT